MKYDVDFIEALRSARDRLSELNTPLPERNPVSAVGPFETTVEPAPAPAPSPQSAFSDADLPTFTPKMPNPAGVLQSIGAFDFLEPAPAPSAPKQFSREPALSPPYQAPREDKPVSAFDFAVPEQAPVQEAPIAPDLGVLGEAFGVIGKPEGKPNPAQLEWIQETRADAESSIADGKRLMEQIKSVWPDREQMEADPAYEIAKNMIEGGEKKLSRIKAIEGGTSPLPTKTGLRAGVESTAQSLGTTLVGAPVKFAGIVQGYAKKVAGSDAAPDEASIYQTGKQIDDFVRQVFPGDEARADEFGQKLSHGIGSLTAFYGTGAIQTITRLGPKAFHLIAQSFPFLLGGSLSSSQHFEAATEKMKEGKDVSEADRAKATATGFALGLTEALPVTATMKAASTMKKGVTAAQKVKNVGTQAAIGAAEEGAQEFGQSVASDITAKELYDPERKIGETAAEEGLIGTLLGGGARGTSTAISEVRGEKKAAKKKTPPPEDEAPAAEPEQEAAAEPETAFEEAEDEDIFEELPDDDTATAKKPAPAESESDLDEVATLVDTEPSEAQKEAGNYRKASVKLTPKGLGVKVAIETPKGAERRGVDADGKEWSATAQAHYGYIKGEEGKDGDAVDIFLGPDLKSQEVTVVNQIDPKTGKLDEHKILYGFKDQEAAEKAYRGSYSDKADRVGSIYTVPVDEFKGWLKDGDKRKEFAPAASDTKFALKKDAGSFTHEQNLFRAAWDESTQSLDGLVNRGFEGEAPAATRRASGFTGEARTTFDRLISDYKQILSAYESGDRDAAVTALNGAVETAAKLDKLDDSPRTRLFTQHARSMARQHLGVKADKDTRFALTRKPAKVAPEGAPDAQTTVLAKGPAKSRKPSGTDRGVAGEGTAGRAELSEPVGPRGKLQGKDAPQAPSNEAFEVPGFRGEFKDLSPVEGGLARRKYSLYPEGSSKNAKPVATMHVRQASNGRGFVYDVEAPGSGAKLYDQVEKHFGVKLQPSGLLTESGHKFWKKRDPETVKWHQWSAEEEMYLSPRQLLERREEGSATQEIDDLWEDLPADAQIAAADGDAMFALRGFYSPAIRAAENISQAKGTGEQFYKQITKVPGVRKDELEWMGLEEFLADKKSITKDEVLAFMRAHQVELDEKVLGDTLTATKELAPITVEEALSKVKWSEDWFEQADKIWSYRIGDEQYYITQDEAGDEGFGIHTADGQVMEGEPANLAQAQHMLDGQHASMHDDEGLTKFADHKVPGGTNYRELLIRLPELGPKKVEGLGSAEQRLNDLAKQQAAETDDEIFSRLGREIAAANEEVIRLRTEELPRYESQHFQDQEIVHLRVDDRTINLPEPKNAADIRARLLDLDVTSPEAKALTRELHPTQKVLFVNEIQSDLHQKGRKSGYDGERAPKVDRAKVAADLDAAKAEAADYAIKNRTTNLADDEHYHRLLDRQAALVNILADRVERPPNAPFKGDLWLELALKRALLYASENGYDAVSWARSDQIAKAVGAEPESLTLQYDSKIGKFLDKYTRKWGGKVEELALPELSGSRVDSKESIIYDMFAMGHKGVAGRVGRMLELNPGMKMEEARTKLSPEDRARLDDEIAKFLSENSNPLLRITPEMRASVMEGQPLAIGNGKRGYRLTAEAANNREKIFAEVEAEINRMAPGVKIRFKDLPQGVEGAYVKSLTSIFVALKANDPKAIGDHEVIHAVRALNIINEAEWSTLKAAAIKNDWLDKHNVPDEYSKRFNDLVQRGELTEEQALDQMYEEAVAWEFAEWRKGKRPASTAWQRLFQRLNAFINRIMRALKGQKIEAYEQVFETVAKGPEARQRDAARERMESQNRADLSERIIARIAGLSVEDAEAALDSAMARFAATSNKPDRPQIDADIVKAYQQALARNRPGNKWVYLEDLRAGLTEYSREEVDAALKRLMLERERGVTAVDLTIQDDQGSLTEAQRAAATRFGASRQDMIAIDPSSPLNNPQASSQRDPQRIDDFDDDAAFALSGRRNPTSAIGRAYEEFYDGYAGLEPESRRYMRNRSRSYFQRAAGAFGSQLQSIRNTWQDNFLPVRRLEEAQKREQNVDLPDDMQPYMREELYHSRLQTRIEDFEESHVEPLKKAIAESGIDLEQLEVYLYAKHAEERNKQIASINPKMQDGGSGMSTADARIVLQAVQNSGKAADYDRIAAMVYAINDAKLDARVEYGLMTQDEADTLRKTYQTYVPLKGDPQHDAERTPPSMNVPKGFSVTNKDMVRAMGRKSRAHDLISRSVQDYLETLVRGERNRVAQSLYEMLKAHPMPDVALIDTPKMKRFIDKRTGMQTALVANAPVQTAKQFREMVKEQSDPLSFLDPNTMSVVVNGERHSIRFLKPELRDAMMNVGITQGMGLMKAAWAFNRWIAMMATSLNPSFALPNFIRDFQAAGINLMAAGHKKAFRRVMSNSVRGMKAIIAVETGGGTGQWADLYREMRRTGGATGFYSLKDWERQQAQLARDVRLLRAGLLNPERRANALWKGFKDVVGGFNNIFENATRLAAYKIALESGLSKEKAASIAKNITVNFNRRGRLDSPASKMVLAMYLFANPSIQGSHRLSKAFKDATPGRRYGILASLVGLGAMTALYNVLIGAALGDDEEKNIYETTSDYDRANNWLFLNPFAERKEGVSGRDAVAFKMPMPYGYGAIVNLGRLLMEHAIYQNTDLLKEERTAGKTFGEIVSIAHGHFDPLGAHPNPLAAVMPTVVKPFVEMYTNTKFHGGPVYPMSFDPSEPDTDLAFRTTSDKYKQIARWVNGLGGGDEYHKGKLLGVETDFSPETLKHIWTFGIGGLGNEIARLYTMGERQYVTKEPIRLNDIPIIRRFVSDEVGYGYSNDYYAIRDEKMKPYEDVRRDASKGSQAAKDILPNLELEKRLYAIYKKSDKLLTKYRKDIKANDKARDDGKVTTEAWAREQQDIYDLRQLATMRFMVEYYAERQMLDLERDKVTAPNFKAKARSLINRRRERARYNISAIEQSIKGGDIHGKPPVTDLSKIKKLADKLREGGGLLSPIAEFVD